MAQSTWETGLSLCRPVPRSGHSFLCHPIHSPAGAHPWDAFSKCYWPLLSLWLVLIYAMDRYPVAPVTMQKLEFHINWNFLLTTYIKCTGPVSSGDNSHMLCVWPVLLYSKLFPTRSQAHWIWHLICIYHSCCISSYGLWLVHPQAVKKEVLSSGSKYLACPLLESEIGASLRLSIMHLFRAIAFYQVSSSSLCTHLSLKDTNCHFPAVQAALTVTDGFAETLGTSGQW